MFKIGDTVERIAYESTDMPIGSIHVVKGVNPSTGYIDLGKGGDCEWYAPYYRLVEPAPKKKVKTTPHKHAKVIKAWADGKVIEYSVDEIHWDVCGQPEWSNRLFYRVKVGKKPNVIRYVTIKKGKKNSYPTIFISSDVDYTTSNSYTSKPNAIMTFDGETNELLTIEKINS